MRAGNGRMWKRLGSVALGWAALALSAPAESTPVSVTVGKMEVVDVPFPVEGYRLANPDVAKVEAQGERRLRVLGVKVGSSDLQVTGRGGVAAMFSITVLEDVKAVFGALMRDLDTVPEAELSINLGRVTLRGEISNIRHWQHLQKVLQLYPKEQVANLTTFQPAPEVMIALRDALQKAGFNVLQEDAKGDPAPGSLRLNYSGNSVFIGGSVYSGAETDRIRQIVSAQDWLTLAGGEEKRENALIKAIINVAVAPVMLELDVVFVGVTDEEARQTGVNLAKAGLLVVDATGAVFDGVLGRKGAGESHGSFGGAYRIGTGIQGALKFFAGSGPGRFRTAGHMTFKNDAPEWRTYHSGGTLKLRTATSDRVGLDDIDYGLIMKVKGGLTDSRTVALEVELELSYPSPVGTDYDLKRNKIQTTVMCDLNQTLVMGGMKSLIEQSSREGVPFLRSIPVVQWMFSEKMEQKQDSTVLILMSPRIMGAPVETTPVSAETVGVQEEAARSTDEIERERRGRKRRFFFF